MPFLITGSNDFYEGWLACFLEQPRLEVKGKNWNLGWETAREIDDDDRMIELRQEIERKNVTVNPQ